MPVLCLAGDGGLMFSPGEIMAAVDESLDITFVVWNNSGFGEIADAMRGAQVPITGCDPTPPRFDHLARAFGLPFTRIGPDPGAFAEALGLPRRGPRMIEIAVR
ncbi:MAG: thiamine pyrophosphate-dependent enzyme [Paracoccaceae bacterium]